jgi:hypothetical protein
MAAEDSLFINADTTLEGSFDRSEQSTPETVKNTEPWVNESVDSLYPWSSDVALGATNDEAYREEINFDDFVSADLTLPPFQTLSVQQQAYNGEHGQPAYTEDGSRITVVSNPSLSRIISGNDPMKITCSDDTHTTVNLDINSGRSQSATDPRKHDKVNDHRRGSDMPRSIPSDPYADHGHATALSGKQRKDTKTQSLEGLGRELITLRKMLQTYVFMLKNDLLEVKCRCLDYSTCKCDQIREFLQNTVVS